MSYQAHLNFEVQTYLQKRIAKNKQRTETFEKKHGKTFCGCSCHSGLEKGMNVFCLSCLCDTREEDRLNSSEKLFGESQKALQQEKGGLDHLVEQNEIANIPEIQKEEKRKILKSAIREWSFRQKKSEEILK